MNLNATKNIKNICTILTLSLACSVNASIVSYNSPEKQKKTSEMYAKNFKAASRKIERVERVMQEATPLPSAVIAHGIMPYLINRFTLLTTVFSQIPLYHITRIVLLSNTELAMQYEGNTSAMTSMIKVVEVSTGRCIKTIESLPKGLTFPVQNSGRSDCYWLTQSPKLTYTAAQNYLEKGTPLLRISFTEDRDTVVYSLSDLSKSKNLVNDISYSTDSASFSPEENAFVAVSNHSYSYFAQVEPDIQMPTD